MADATTSPDALWHKVAEAGEVADGEVRPVRSGGMVLALVRIGERYGALYDRCPHMGGPLSQGAIEDGRLVCPWHGREYDPFTGHCHGFGEAVRVCAVEARADGVYVALD
jgi:nitrite reductase/ring-hydroxylating ferredoxin subunit